MNKNKRKKLSILICMLGFWLLATPVTFGFADHAVLANDMVCGVILVLLSLYSFSHFSWSYAWIFIFIGFWLNLAPLVLWAPSRVYFVNDTYIGIALLSISFLFINENESSTGSEKPPGWSYNPSSWSHRVPVIFLALLCYFLTRYLASYQLGYINTIWDPFFGQGTVKVLNSKIAQSFPISDAGAGGLAYLLEVLLEWQGGTARWKTSPWAVLSFGFLAIPVGLISITLVVLQPLVVNAWCFLCLLTAACMLMIICFAIGEVIATLQCMKREMRLGKSFWKCLFYGCA